MAIFRGTGGAGDANNDITINQVVELTQTAEDAALAASSSASAAANSASSASDSASSASDSATASANSATASANSATDAETAETNAENAQSYAEEWATKAEDSLVSTDAGGDGSTDYSALHHATKASASATSASGSATTATTKAGEASDSADDASKLAVNPEDSQYTLSDGTTTGYSALHYNAKAGASASAASTSENNASDSATDASKLAVNAEDSQYTLSDGTTTGYSALHYNAKAQAAKTAAENARDATLTAYDNFDDRYLGVKSSDPTLDNDGDALVAGALYFNNVDEKMKLYTGSAWVAAYVSGGDYVGQTSATGSAEIPTGTTGERDGTPEAGMFRFNTTESSFEGYDGSEWGAVGGGNTAVVGWENQITVAEDYTITSGNNMMSAGPITVDSGFSVVVPSGSRWVIV